MRFKLGNCQSKGRTWIGLLVMGMLLCSCGGPVTNSNYYNPAWMADGRIIAVRDDVVSYSGGVFSSGGHSEHKYYLVVMNSDGSNEHVVKDVGENIPMINVSPSGNYIAHDDGAVIAILDANYKRVSSIPWKTKGTVWRLFDWSPDESKIVVLMDGKTELFSIDGGYIRQITEIIYLYSWKYGKDLLGQADGKVMLVDEMNQIITEKQDGPGGDEYFSDGQYYLGANLLGGLGKVRVSDFEVVETYPTLNEILNSINYRRIHLNPVTRTTLLYSEPNTRLGDDPQGIWLINLDGTEQRQLRK